MFSNVGLEVQGTKCIKLQITIHSRIFKKVQTTNYAKQTKLAHTCEALPVSLME